MQGTKLIPSVDAASLLRALAQLVDEKVIEIDLVAPAGRLVDDGGIRNGIALEWRELTPIDWAKIAGGFWKPPVG